MLTKIRTKADEMKVIIKKKTAGTVAGSKTADSALKMATVQNEINNFDAS
jgi:hypothetical protein